MTLLLALALLLTSPHDAYAATAIATCESGNTVTFGSYVWTARNTRTNDGGAFQFNDYTWSLVIGQGQGHTSSPLVQTKAFKWLYEHGSGISHWSSSQRCWSQWIDDNGDPISQTHYDAFVRIYLLQLEQIKGAKK